MKTHDKVTEAQLKKQGFNFLTNFGSSKVYAKESERVMVGSDNHIVVIYEVSKNATPSLKNQTSNG